MGSSPPRDRGSSPLSRGHLRCDTPGGNEDRTDGTPTALTVRHGKPGNGSKRESCASVFGLLDGGMPLRGWVQWPSSPGRWSAVGTATRGRARTMLSSNHRWPCSPSTHSRADVPSSGILGCGPS